MIHEVQSSNREERSSLALLEQLNGLYAIVSSKVICTNL